MNIKKIITLGAVACGAAYFSYMKFSAPSDFMYAGTLETTNVTISSKVNGEVVVLQIREGQKINKGDLIAQIDKAELEIENQWLNKEYDRYKKLAEKGSVSQEKFEEISKNTKLNKLRLQWCDVQSPINGVVIDKLVEKGEYVTTGRCVAVIANQDDIWAYFYVPYDVISKIQVGQKVSGVLQEMPDKIFEGVIIKINEEAEFTPKNVQTREERTRLVYGVKVQFKNTGNTLKAGMTMECSLISK